MSLFHGLRSQYYRTRLSLWVKPHQAKSNRLFAQGWLLKQKSTNKSSGHAFHVGSRSMAVAKVLEVQPKKRDGAGTEQKWKQRQRVEGKLGDPDAQAWMKDDDEYRNEAKRKRRHNLYAMVKAGDPIAQARLQSRYDSKKKWGQRQRDKAKSGDPIAQAWLKNDNKITARWRRRQREKARLGDPEAQAYVIRYNKTKKDWYRKQVAMAKAGDPVAQAALEKRRERQRQRRLIKMEASNPSAQERSSEPRADHIVTAGDGTAEARTSKHAWNSRERLAKFSEEVEKDEWKEKLERYWQTGDLGKLYQIQLYHTLRRMGYPTPVRKKVDLVDRIKEIMDEHGGAPML